MQGWAWGRLQPLEGARRGGRAAAAAFIGPGSCSSTQGSAPASRAAPPRLVRRRPEGRSVLPLGALLGVLLSLAVLKLGQFLSSEALLPGGMVTHSRGVGGLYQLYPLSPVPAYLCFRRLATEPAATFASRKTRPPTPNPPSPIPIPGCLCSGLYSSFP